jgi:hypothetical protein
VVIRVKVEIGIVKKDAASAPGMPKLFIVII